MGGAHLQLFLLPHDCFYLERIRDVLCYLNSRSFLFSGQTKGINGSLLWGIKGISGDGWPSSRKQVPAYTCPHYLLDCTSVPPESHVDGRYGHLVFRKLLSHAIHGNSSEPSVPEPRYLFPDVLNLEICWKMSSMLSKHNCIARDMVGYIWCGCSHVH